MYDLTRENAAWINPLVGLTIAHLGLGPMSAISVSISLRSPPGRDDVNRRPTDRSPRSLNVFMWHVVRSAVKSTYSIEDHCKVLLHCHVLAGCRYPIHCHLIIAFFYVLCLSMGLLAFQGVQYLLWCFLESIEKNAIYSHNRTRECGHRGGCHDWRLHKVWSLIAFYVNPSQRANVNPRQQCGYKNGYAGLREFS